MANIFTFNYSEIFLAFLVLMRVSAFLVTWPLFSQTNVPQTIKVLMSLLITLMLVPVVTTHGVPGEMGTYETAMRVIKEVFIGVSIGFLSRMFFYIMNVSGQIMSVSMGLSGVELINPATGSRSTPLDQFQVMLASLVFLAIQGHHMFLRALTESFRIVPLSQMTVNITNFETFTAVLQRVTLIGVQLSAPVLISILVMNVVMAIIGRAVPQINVLITSLPVNILVGFLIVFISVPIIVGRMPGILDETTFKMFQLLKSY